MPLIVFVSLFLGIISGAQNVELRVDPSVRAVRLELDGREIARLSGPPWEARVDFGDELVPRRLTAVGLDAEGHEVTRSEQLINLWRPVAELEIAVARRDGRVEVQLSGRHRAYRKISSARLSLDDRPVTLSAAFAARLPELDKDRPHILSAEMRFEDGAVARRERVIEGGGFSEAVDSELTPILVNVTTEKTAVVEQCFAVGGKPLRVSRVEKPDALVLIVKDPDVRELATVLRNRGTAPIQTRSGEAITIQRQPSSSAPRLSPGVTARLVWPISERIRSNGEATAVAYPHSDTRTTSVNSLLLSGPRVAPPRSQPREFADAMAISGVASLELARRRAVVLVDPAAADHSLYAPAVVRRYLRRIGVPLFVWSLSRPSPEAIEAWGPADDISTAAGDAAAVDRLNRALDAQRIAWVAAEPLAALQATARDDCGLTPVAGQ